MMVIKKFVQCISANLAAMKCSNEQGDPINMIIILNEIAGLKT